MRLQRPARAGALAAAALLALFCSTDPSPRSSPAASPPDLPSIALDAMGDEARTRLRAAYDAARREPEDGDAAGRLGMLLHGYHQYASAERYYARARALQPEAFRWAYYLGTVQLLLGRDAQAAATLREAVRLDPSYVPAQLALADVLLAAGALEESWAHYRAVADRRPGLALAHFGLGRVLSAKGDSAGALAHYREACERAPTFGAARYALAMAYRDQGDAERSREHLALYETHRGRAAPIDDPLLGDVELLGASEAVRLFKAALEHARAGQVPAAIDGFEAALERDPSLSEARANLITLYAGAGDLTRAGAHYRAGMAADPDQAGLHYAYGVTMREAARLDEAADALERALEIDPAHAAARIDLGLVREAQGRIEEAATLYRAALEGGHDARPARLQLGWILLTQGRDVEAAEQFRIMTSVADTETAGFLFRAAAAYGRAGREPEALDYARRARARALADGQHDLVAAIDRVLEGAPAR